MAEAGLVLASSSPVRSGPGVFGGVHRPVDRVDQEAADRRWREVDHALVGWAGSPFAARDRATASQAWASIDKVMWAYQARQVRTW